MARGVDGLTTEELRSSRDSWWDDPFTRLLLEAIPAEANLLVEIGCGLARVAHAVLPHRSRLRYVGIDVDGARLADARQKLAASAHGDRADLVRAAGERLPVADRAVDVVLTAMTLQHVVEPRVVLDEARRVLAGDGMLVVAEPDNLGQRYYFDGPLEEITAAFTALAADRRAARAPADLAIGPRVPSLLRAAGWREIALRAHTVQETGCKSAALVAAGLRSIAELIAAPALERSGTLLQACNAAVDRWLAEVGPETEGQYATIVPVFVTRARY